MTLGEIELRKTTIAHTDALVTWMQQAIEIIAAHLTGKTETTALVLYTRHQIAHMAKVIADARKTSGLVEIFTDLTQVGGLAVCVRQLVAMYAPAVPDVEFPPFPEVTLVVKDHK